MYHMYAQLLIHLTAVHVCIYRWYKKCILLLNKQDRLRAKVLEGRFKIETYFPEYSTYQLNSHGELIVFLFIIFEL